MYGGGGGLNHLAEGAVDVFYTLPTEHSTFVWCIFHNVFAIKQKNQPTNHFSFKILTVFSTDTKTLVKNNFHLNIITLQLNYPNSFVISLKNNDFIFSLF